MTDHAQHENHRSAGRLGWWISARRQPFFWAILAMLLVAGYLLRGGSERSHGLEDDAAASAPTSMWTCSMHPQIQLPEPGRCPICFMDLIPVPQGGGADDGPRVLTVSESARALAQIVTTPVRRGWAHATVRLVGKVDYDETRVADIVALVPGRLSRLYVDYTGIRVRKGEHMIEIDSPGLYAAQEELLQAVARSKQVTDVATGRAADQATELVESAREKLRRWGLLDEQMRQIEARGTPSDLLTIYAPISGVVIDKRALEGTYVMVGNPIYRIADLTTVWVMLEAYESDLPWLRYGQQVTITSAALPGEVVTGRIVFIDPILDPMTRTVRVRVNVPNSDYKLKPGMFVRGVVEADIATSGLVLDRSLADKWMCPMHPEVVSTASGACSICGMPLERATSLGYASISKDTLTPPLVIPASAPLITGQRAVVYVKLPDRSAPTYEGREVILGPRAGDEYIVVSGLSEGEEVVVNGAFKIDSELQIRAKPSMMSPQGGAIPAGHLHNGMDRQDHRAESTPGHPQRVSGLSAAFLEALGTVYDSYFNLAESLAADDNETARRAMSTLANSVFSISSSSRPEATSEPWATVSNRLIRTAGRDFEADDWNSLRAAFDTVSAAMIECDYRFGHTDSLRHYVTFCPMAFNNRGASWLAKTEAVFNPYFGQAMLKCGKVTDRIAGSMEASDE